MSASSHTTESFAIPSLSPHTLSCLFFQFNYLLPLKHLQQFICGKNQLSGSVCILMCGFFFFLRETGPISDTVIWEVPEWEWKVLLQALVCKWEGVFVHWCFPQLLTRDVFVPCNQNSPSWLIELAEWLLDIEMLKVGKDWTSVLDWL